jgi:lipopolysaccharide export system permease protein
MGGGGEAAMSLLDRYVAKRFLRSFLAVLLGACALYGVIDFADRAGDYTGAGWFLWVLRLYGNRLAKVAVLISPAAMLIASGLTLSALRARSELVAALAGGRSPARLVVPLALCSLLVGAAVYQFDDSVAVHSALKAERISAEHFHIWGAYRTYLAPKRWLKLEGRILQLGDALPEGGYKDASIFEMSKDFSLVRRIDAEAMRPAGGDSWLLRGVQLRRFDVPAGARGSGPQFERAAELRLDLPGAAAIQQVAPGRPEMLSRSELRHQIDVRQLLGLGTEEDWFEYYSRVAYVLVGCAGTLLAAALALRGNRRGNVSTALLEGLVVAGVLWAFLGIAKALSISGKLPPLVCAFAPELFGVAAGLALLAQVNRRASW